MPQTDQRPQKIEGVCEWLEARDFFFNRCWRISNGEFVTNIDGETLNTKQFLNRYPIPFKLAFYMGDENPDGTKRYYYKPKIKNK